MPGRGVPLLLRATPPEFAVHALLLSFGIVFVAELGDKSQLMAHAFAARYRPLPILIGIIVATGVVHLFSVVAGALLGAALPTKAISVVAGIAADGIDQQDLDGEDRT
jgi:putative Ca2+/H+ antiporter (TMEM165/GDT1 family)